MNRSAGSAHFARRPGLRRQGVSTAQVSQVRMSPDWKPVWNHFTRDAADPCVQDSWVT